MRTPIERFKYQDGVLVWKDGQCAGKVAGCRRSDGYWALNSRNTVHLRHHIVWEMYHGTVPDNHFIDHIDGDRGNDRIENLRLATLKESARNVSKHKDNQSGFKGVTWYKRRYKAVIWNGTTQETLGYSENPEECARMYNKRAIELFGEFAKLNEILKTI